MAGASESSCFALSLLISIGSNRPLVKSACSTRASKPFVLRVILMRLPQYAAPWAFVRPRHLFPFAKRKMPVKPIEQGSHFRRAVAGQQHVVHVCYEQALDTFLTSWNVEQGRVKNALNKTELVHQHTGQLGPPRAWRVW